MTSELKKEKKFKGVRAALAAKGYTIGDLAKELNLSLPTVSMKMTGKSDFSLKEMRIICSFLDVDAGIFFED